MRSSPLWALAAALLLPACDTEPEEGEARNDTILALEGDVAAGESTFTMMACGTQTCHGADGVSGDAISLANRVPILSDEALINAVLDGSGSMPATASAEPRVPPRVRPAVPPTGTTGRDQDVRTCRAFAARPHGRVTNENGSIKSVGWPEPKR